MRALGLMRTSSMPPFQASPPQVCWPMRKRVLLATSAPTVLSVVMSTPSR